MTKLRNIGYLRFGSKILQGFAGFLTSLTPPLSLSPLWISWAENEGAEGRVGVLYLRREPAAPLPGGRPPAAACRPAGGRQAPSKDLCVNFFYFYLHIGPYRPPAGRPPPCRPLPGGRGIEL